MMGSPTAKASGPVFPPNAKRPAGIESYDNATLYGYGGGDANGWDVASAKAERGGYGVSHDRQGDDGCGGGGRGHSLPTIPTSSRWQETRWRCCSRSTLS